MIYGLYLSATGVLANSHRQDVIANNLANSETVGFKRDLARFQEMGTAAQRRGGGSQSNPHLEPLGGGMQPLPTYTDLAQGELEASSNSLDVAIQGQGFFAVRERGRILLTRNGQFSVNADGNLALSSGGQEVLDAQLRPIPLDPTARTAFDEDGTITQAGLQVGRLGVFDLQNPAMLRKRGDSLLDGPSLDRQLRQSDALVRGAFTERSNAEPSIELAALLETQRQLEANANMIRYQDQTLGRLVNDVGKIG